MFVNCAAEHTARCGVMSLLERYANAIAVFLFLYV